MTLKMSLQHEGLVRDAGPLLARLFSSGVLRDFAKLGRSNTATRILYRTGLLDIYESSTIVSDLYDDIFDYLTSEYRYEYIYKNAIAEKILLGKHNLNTASMIMEFQVGECKADAIVFNSSSHVYEIKSEFDDYTRLNQQIEAYMRVFEYISVITTESQYCRLEEYLPDNIGIMVLAENNYRFLMSPRRDAQSNLQSIESSAIFDCLQRNEFLSILKKLSNASLCDIPNTQIYKIAKPIFSEIPPSQAHSAMVDVLKKRNRIKFFVDIIDASPRSLKAAMLSLNLTKQGYNDLLSVMYTSIYDMFK